MFHISMLHLWLDLMDLKKTTQNVVACFHMIYWEE